MQSIRTAAVDPGRSPASRLAGSFLIAGGSLRRWPARRWWVALAGWMIMHARLTRESSCGLAAAEPDRESVSA